MFQRDTQMDGARVLANSNLPAMAQSSPSSQTMGREASRPANRLGMQLKNYATGSSLASAPLFSSLALITVTPLQTPQDTGGSLRRGPVPFCHFSAVRESQGEYDRASYGMWGSESEEGGGVAPPARVETEAACKLPRDPGGPAWHGSQADLCTPEGGGKS